MSDSLVFATTIKKLRIASRLTQDEAAGVCHIPLSTYRSYEQGKSEPSYSRAQSILSVLGSRLAESEGGITTETERAQDVFYLVLTMNGQKFYQFRCIGEVVGNVEFSVDLKASTILPDEGKT